MERMRIGQDRRLVLEFLADEMDRFLNIWATPTRTHLRTRFMQKVRQVSGLVSRRADLKGYPQEQLIQAH